MKTITVKGKVYEVDGLYMDEDGNIGMLISHDGRTFKMKSGDRGFWHCDKLNTFEIGTIKDAPIEPEDGEWYMCEDHKGRQAVLYYTDNQWLDSRSNPVTQIAPLYKMVKAEV